MTAIGKLSSMNFSGYVGCVTTFSRVLATYCMLVSSRIWIRCRFISGWLVIIHTHLYYLPLSLSLSLVIAVVVVVILEFFYCSNEVALLYFSVSSIKSSIVLILCWQISQL